jgi:hypothetical protein
VKKWIVLLAVMALACEDDTMRAPVKIDLKPNGFEVSMLFAQDGVKVYRFWDKGEWRYFATSGAVKWSTTRDAGTGDGQTVTDHHEVTTAERAQ